MPLPSSLLAYKAEMDFFELAMDEARGSRMFFGDRQSAEHFRMRANYARVLHRADNRMTHEPGTPLHGRSEYDILTFTIRESDDGFWVYARKAELDTSRVEPIPEDDSVPLNTIVESITETTDERSESD